MFGKCSARRPVAALCLLLLAAPAALPAEEPEPAAPTASVTVEVTPTETTVGGLLNALITVELPADASLEPPPIGPKLGPFTVRSGGWAPTTVEGESARWIWTGALTAFEVGELEIPPIAVHIDGPDGSFSIESEPQSIKIASVLAAEDRDAATAEPADIKPPASLDPDYTPLWTALIILGALLLVSLVLWWLHRRYGARLAAAPAPEDPFHRTPPHVWVYAELQKLLERRLPEQGQVELFYSEVSRILKLYLSGRYRLELMERTTAEVPPSLKQAGAPEPSILVTRGVLAGCDRVKFARESPGPSEWKAAIEQIYRVVDTTKPLEAKEKTAEAPAS